MELQWPVPGSDTVSSEYGTRMHPILGERKKHTGIDIDAEKSDSIVAAGDGEVLFTGEKGVYGRTVVISHGNGITTLYAHCHSIVVEEGTQVENGQIIAEVGESGRTTGPHLHFEVRRNGTPQNPARYITL